MPTIYKLISPISKHPYYVGYTEQSITERLVEHLYTQKQKTTKDLIVQGIKPDIEVIEEGDNVTKETEMYWIQRLANEGFYLENRDGLVAYQNRDYLYQLPTELLNSIKMSDAERYRAAIGLVLSEMPLSVSVPILIRIKAILEWSLNP